MSWFKASQIPAKSLSAQVLWYHGTDNFSAYSLIQNMYLKPRSETGNTSYQGSLSSIPSAVYLTNNVGKAAKHAIDRCEQTKGQPVIFVIDPTSLGAVHVDEDFVHMLLNGQDYFSEGNWYPSPQLVEEIFEIADSATRATDYYPELSVQKAVIKYLKSQDENAEVEDEYMQEEGVVPDESGFYEYDESMHLAKQIAAELSNKHQQEAIQNFQSMAHQGQVQAKEVYLVPTKINASDDPKNPYWASSTVMKSYEDLKKHGTQIDPRQLIMDFLKKS